MSRGGKLALELALALALALAMKMNLNMQPEQKTAAKAADQKKYEQEHLGTSWAPSQKAKPSWRGLSWSPWSP